MPIDSVEIKLERKGVDISPEYSITIKGDGSVIYEGINNVSRKGLVESKINRDDFVSILSDFKKHGFFKFEEKYPVINSEGRPFNILSIKIPGESGVKTKSVVFYHNDNNAPSGLKEISDKIDNLVNSSRWVDGDNDIESKVDSFLDDSKNSNKKPSVIKKQPPKKEYPLKIIAGAISIIFIVSIFAFLFMSGFFGNNISQDPVEYDPIYYDFPDLSSFELGETANIMYTLGNITHNNKTDISTNINVKKDGELIKSFNEDFSSNVNNSFYTLNFNFTVDDSWDLGSYQIVFYISDDISGETISKNLYFNVTKIYPKILVLTTASNIRKYQDYDVKSIFDPSDPIFVYLEYTDINTTFNNLICDIQLTINVTSDNQVLFYNATSKSTVKNNTHAWWFTPDSSWPVDNIYSVNINLLDRRTGLSVKDSTFFYIQ